MPSPHKRRLEQQRARRERGHEQFPWDSPGDLERRKKQTSGVHKSRVASNIEALIEVWVPVRH